MLLFVCMLLKFECDKIRNKTYNNQKGHLIIRTLKSKKNIKYSKSINYLKKLVS